MGNTLLLRVEYGEKPFSQDLDQVQVIRRLLQDAKEALPRVYRQLGI